MVWCCSLAQLWGMDKGQRAGAVFIFCEGALALPLLGLLISLWAGAVCQQYSALGLGQRSRQPASRELSLHLGFKC